METTGIEDRLTTAELHEIWPLLSPDERWDAFHQLDRDGAQDFFMTLSAKRQASILTHATEGERRLWLRLLSPEEAANVLLTIPADDRDTYLDLLDQKTRIEVKALLAYKRDMARGLMSPNFVKVRTDFTVDEAISYFRLQARTELKMARYIYVIHWDETLAGVLSIRTLFTASSNRKIEEIMTPNVVAVFENQDPEEVAHLFAEHNFMALPVLDPQRRIKGIITAENILQVQRAETTEDIHKMGGMEALDRPYFEMRFFPMLKRRAGWLSVLFLGEVLTASVMGFFEEEISKLVVLALFLPLIISSGGNAGSQATTLVIQAMALGEASLRHWWRILYRELGTGLGLGLILAVLGVLRIVGWQGMFQSYGDQYLAVALAVGFSLVGVVMWGAVMGAMLPLLLRKLGFDPASASAPFVATLVDVFGIVIYFGIASVVLRDHLL
jgi:magnesium transporter